MTVDPLAFLHATLDAVQAEAEAATPGPWFAHEYIDYACGFEATIGTGHGQQADDKTDVIGHGYEGGGVQKLADAVFIARHNPAAVLRRIAADRKLIAAHPITTDVRDVRHSSFGCRTCHRWDDRIEGRGYCDTITVIAEGWGWTAETPID